MKKLWNILVRGWLGFGAGMNYVMSRLLLSLLFFLLLSPMALICRLAGKKSLMKTDAGRKSYYHDRRHSYSQADLRNPW